MVLVFLPTKLTCTLQHRRASFLRRPATEKKCPALKGRDTTLIPAFFMLEKSGHGKINQEINVSLAGSLYSYHL